jgi:hypothetical protein
VTDIWRPKVGDTIRMVKPGPSISSQGSVGGSASGTVTAHIVNFTHGSAGEVFRVIRDNGTEIFLDHCSCRGSIDSHLDFGWTWVSWRDWFEPYQPITFEDAEKAQPMPSPDDVASYFKVKP